MITEQMVKQSKATQAITPTAGAAGATDIEGATLDMQNCEGVLVEVTFGAITAGAVTGITMQGSNSSDMSGAVTYTTPAHTIADTDDGKVYLLDLYRPAHRYVRVHVDRATQNAVVAGATYFQYGLRTLIQSLTGHGATVVAAAAVSPAYA